MKGLWLFRGKEVPKFVMDEVYDMELYDWKAVDINDEAQKELVNQMIEIMSLSRERLFWMQSASSNALNCIWCSLLV